MTDKDKLLHKIVRLIKPDDMSYSEYVLKCTVRSIDVSLDNAMFMHWVFREAFTGQSDIHEKVRKLCISGLKKHLIGDFTQDDFNGYFCELLSDPACIFCRDPDTKDLFETILREYRNTPVGDTAYKINKAFGFTSYCYFQDGKDSTDLFKDILGCKTKDENGVPTEMYEYHDSQHVDQSLYGDNSSHDMFEMNQYTYG